MPHAKGRKGRRRSASSKGLRMVKHLGRKNRRVSETARRSSDTALEERIAAVDARETPVEESEKPSRAPERRRILPQAIGEPPGGIRDVEEHAPPAGLPDWPEHLKPLPLYPSRKFELETPYCGLGTDILSGLTDPATAIVALDLPTENNDSGGLRSSLFVMYRAPTGLEYPSEVNPQNPQAALPPLTTAQLADPHANCVIQDRELLRGTYVVISGQGFLMVADAFLIKHSTTEMSSSPAGLAQGDSEEVLSPEARCFEAHFGAWAEQRRLSVVGESLLGQPLSPSLLDALPALDRYDLVLCPDTGTYGNTQWFFFSISNVTKGKSVKLSLVTMGKPSSLFQKGMQPVVWSTREFHQGDGMGWSRGAGIGSLQYGKTNTHRHLLTNVAADLKMGEVCDGVAAVEVPRQAASFAEASVLTFEYTPQWEDDTVYFAYTFPYTLTRLQGFIKEMEGSRGGRRYLARYPLCRSLAGNRLDVLTITSSGEEDDPTALAERGEEDTSQSLHGCRKKYIAITARVHPGESVSSFACEGLIRELLSESPLAKKLRAKYVFKIIPMLNPDGVVLGNYRTNLSGRDLNRVWNQPCKLLHPTIYFAKRALSRCAPLGVFADLHGHSRKLNWFVYGCLPPRKPRKRSNIPPFVPPPDMRTRDA
ncbi:hypothetical protein FOZ63_021812, partial [Perkinsus olseni]